VPARSELTQAGEFWVQRDQHFWIVGIAVGSLEGFDERLP
jgi:hypothetical protein